MHPAHHIYITRTATQHNGRAFFWDLEQRFCHEVRMAAREAKTHGQHYTVYPVSVPRAVGH